MLTALVQKLNADRSMLKALASRFFGNDSEDFCVTSLGIRGPTRIRA